MKILVVGIHHQSLLQAMFYDASSFNQDLNKWDVSKVTNLYYTFNNATSFNQDLNNWDVSSY